jgi:hypothetical protein
MSLASLRTAERLKAPSENLKLGRVDAMHE